MTRGLDPAQAFTGLVVGGANQLAVSAARAVAESAQAAFNPLVIHGGAGLGKTHLLHAIGHLRLEVEPRSVVRLTSWTDLAEGWVAAEAMGRTADYLVPFAETGLLLLDDAHRMLEREEGREPVLAMLEGRLAARRSTVLATRKVPAALTPVSEAAERLLDAGLIVELGLPDAEMRWEVLYRRCAEAGVDLAPSVLEEIAGLSFDSIRDLLGAVNRLIAFQAVSPGALKPAQARVLITGVLDDPQPDAGVPAAPGEASRPVVDRAVPAEAPDEFGSFLSDVVASVSQQVDRWRGRIADAILRWQGEGFHTARLEALLDQELTTQPEQVLRRFELDVEALRRLEEEVRELAPELAGHEAFRDPDQVELARQVVDEARVRDLAACLPQPQYRLEDLVEGPSSRLALDAARGVAAEPGAGPNPLLVVGEPGTGKTHLLHAVANALVEAGSRGVVCLGAHAFEAAVQEAIDLDQLPSWRQRFRWAGALFIDDVHLLAGREAAQEELAGLLDRMLAADRQVAFSSAVPVAELSGLSPQLLSRLASGIVVELPRPDREVRLGVVRRLLAATEAEDDAALAEYLAARPADTLRAVHAMVQRVLRATDAGRVPLGLALARQVLEAGAARPAGRPAPARGAGLGPTLAGPRLREKLVDDWPKPGDRLIEDLR